MRHYGSRRIQSDGLIGLPLPIIKIGAASTLPKKLVDHSRGLFAVFLISERQVKRPAEYEPMPLIV